MREYQDIHDIRNHLVSIAQDLRDVEEAARMQFGSDDVAYHASYAAKKVDIIIRMLVEQDIWRREEGIDR